MIDCNLLRNCSLIRIKNRGLLGNNRKVPVTREAAENLLGPRPFDMSDDEREAQIKTALQNLKAATKLIVCPELQAIYQYQAAFKINLLGIYCNPSFIDEGLYSVRTSLVSEVVAKFKEAEVEIQERLLPEFIKVYPKKIEEAERVWGLRAVRGLPAPDKAAKQFGIDFRLTQLDVPEGLPPEIREVEEAKLRKAFADAEQAIVAALWGEFKAMLEDVTKKLEVNGDGKKKVFRDTLFDDIAQFVAGFKNKNVFNDTRLTELVKQANELIVKVGGADNAESAQRMRDYEGLREQTKKAFTALTEATEKAIQEEPSRAFSFDE